MRRKTTTATVAPVLDVVMTPEQAAEYLGVTARYLAALREREVGPAFSRLGHRTIRYRQSKLDQWMSECEEAG